MQRIAVTNTSAQRIGIGNTPAQGIGIGNTHTIVVGGEVTWANVKSKPFETIGENLKVINGALDVDTAPNVQKDNTKPITSAAVYTVVGNIDALLSLI